MGTQTRVNINRIMPRLAVVLLVAAALYLPVAMIAPKAEAAGTNSPAQRMAAYRSSELRTKDLRKPIRQTFTSKIATSSKYLPLTQRPLATSAIRRQVASTVVRAATPLGPWVPGSALPSRRNTGSVITAEQAAQSAANGTTDELPPLGRVWDPNRETYDQWWNRVIAGTSADPRNQSNSGGGTGGSTSGGSTGGGSTGGTPGSSGSNSSSNTGGNQNVAPGGMIRGRIFLPDGVTPGVGFTVFTGPWYLNPPFTFPLPRATSDSQGFFEINTPVSGLWFVAVFKETPINLLRNTYLDWEYIVVPNQGMANVTLVSRLGGGFRR